LFSWAKKARFFHLVPRVRSTPAALAVYHWRQEDSKATREKATDYVAIHGTVLAAQLNDWCFQLKKELRDARKAKKEAEEEEEREKLIEQKQQLKELRRQAKEAREKAANDSDFENESEDEAAPPGTAGGDED